MGRAHADELREKAVVYINTDSQRRAASSARAARTRSRRSSTRSRATCADPQTNVSVGRARARRACVVRRHAERAQGGARARRDLRARRAGLGLGLHAVPAAPRHRLAQPRLRRRGRLAASTTRSTTRSTTTRASATPASPTASALAQVGGRLVLRLADADVLPFEFTAVADDRRPLRGRGGEARRRAARRDRGGQPAHRAKGRLAAAADPDETLRRARAKDAGAVPQLRAAAERGRAAAAQRASAYAGARASARDAGAPLAPERRPQVDAS